LDKFRERMTEVSKGIGKDKNGGKRTERRIKVK
jgi:hypothetical protein